MTSFNSLLARAHSKLLSVSDDESGQGALEYIAIVVGLVVLVYVGFKVAGDQISEVAGNFVRLVTGGFSE